MAMVFFKGGDVTEFNTTNAKDWPSNSIGRGLRLKWTVSKEIDRQREGEGERGKDGMGKYRKI